MCFFIALTFTFLLHYGNTQTTTCHPNCHPSAGVCQNDGRCLCWWGMTGPNGAYIDGGEMHNRIVADYCGTPCHFTADVRNPRCTDIERVLDALTQGRRQQGQGRRLSDQYPSRQLRNQALNRQLRYQPVNRNLYQPASPYYPEYKTYEYDSFTSQASRTASTMTSLITSLVISVLVLVMVTSLA